MCPCVSVCVCAQVLPLELVYTRAAAFAYMHKELQIESSGVFSRLSVELLMEFAAHPVTLEKFWRRQETNGTDSRAGIASQTSEGREMQPEWLHYFSCLVCTNKKLFNLKVLRTTLPLRGLVRRASTISLRSRKLIFGEQPTECQGYCVQPGIQMVVISIHCMFFFSFQKSNNVFNYFSREGVWVTLKNSYRRDLFEKYCL